MSLLRDIFTTKSNGVPKDYTKQSKIGKRYDIQKGQLNRMRFRPNILNEHVESSRENMGTVTSSNIIGQIFKASQDNIDSLLLTLGSVPGATLDDFESYADSAALQVEWATTGGVTDAELETTIIQEGSKAMALGGGNAVNEWTDTITSTDYTGYTFSFYWRQTDPYSNLKFEFFISDGVDTLSYPIVVTVEDTWQHIFVDIDAMTDSGSTNKAQITSIGVRVDDQLINSTGYMDKLEATPPPGKVGLKLWNCGTTLPVADGSSFDLATDATQITEIGDWGIDGVVVAEREVSLIGGVRQYHVENFTVGTAREHPNNDLLTVGNYYAITINYVDTDVNVYGADTTFSTNYYQNGYAFSTSAEGTDITVISGAVGSGAYSDLQFGIFSVQDIYIIGYHLHFSDASGLATTSRRGASWLTNVEDSNMFITDVVTFHGGHTITDGDYEQELSWRPPFMEKGGKFEVNYNDDFTDTVSEIELELFYLFIPPTVNG